ncbi:hypothetical protein [Haliovirga abyssi]|uniref:SWIM-type domain-containing protein n=1 Tax=Haliovirga abyssi TaxID=2996794 RepID=A0AAU9D567_9FUSO|nr:hypothetical protein [Haliovirga abyssi]BDU51206.1 hypothetical protein HLVA_17750 [Haliovirga abyssi]
MKDKIKELEELEVNGYVDVYGYEDGGSGSFVCSCHYPYEPCFIHE